MSRRPTTRPKLGRCARERVFLQQAQSLRGLSHELGAVGHPPTSRPLALSPSCPAAERPPRTSRRSNSGAGHGSRIRAHPPVQRFTFWSPSGVLCACPMRCARTGETARGAPVVVRNNDRRQTH